jgi:capsular exopolysaccharide synthesis family protein
MEIIHGRKPSGAALAEFGDASMLRPPPFIEQFDIREIGRVLWRRIGVIVWSLLFVLALGATTIFSLVPRYTASAFVEINPRQTRIVDFEAVLSGLPADSATMETEIEILRSRNLAARAVEKLGLYQNPEFNSALAAPGLVELVVTGLLAELDIPDRIAAGEPETRDETDAASTREKALIDRLLWSLFGERDGKRIDLAHIVEQERAVVVDTFLSRLQVTPQGRSRVMGIFFQSQNPRVAADAANTIADFYIVAQLEAKFEAAKRANAWLSDRIAGLREEVGIAERTVEQFRNKSGLIRGGTDATLTGEQVSELNAQYIVERTRVAEAEARLRQAEKLLGSSRDIETAGEVLSSVTIRDLRREETEVERRVAELSNEYGERHPRMINARAELIDVRDKIRLEISKIIQSLRNEVAVARARAGSLRGALERLKSEVASLNAAEVQLRALEREATASRQLLEQLLSRSKETASQTDFQQPDATIITAAVIPKQPSFPKKPLLFAVSLMLGTVIGLIAAFLVDRLDHGYRSTDQITRDLGIAALGLIPTIGKLKTLGKIPQNYCIEHPTSAYAEALRSFHTNLLLADVGNRPSVVLVASAMPNEGKTSLVVSLARLLSRVGQKVIVVDCDLRRPSVHKAFGMEDGPGLGECMNGNHGLDQLIQEDKLSSAHFIRAGKLPLNPPDLFDSVALQQLLKTLSRSYELVLLDSAPLLAVSDTLFLGRLANSTVLIVRWARTRRETVELALKKLIDARANVAGVLLSMVDVKGHAHYGFSDSGAYHGILKRYYTG